MRIRTETTPRRRLPEVLYKARSASWPLKFYTARVVKEGKESATIENMGGGLYKERIAKLEAELRGDRSRLYTHRLLWRASKADAAADVLHVLKRQHRDAEQQAKHDAKDAIKNRKLARKLRDDVGKVTSWMKPTKRTVKRKR